MKVPVTCPECMKLARDKKLSWDEIVPDILPLQDSGEYLFKCQRGHEAVVIRPEPKFEILFRSGLFALIDGYARESISAFAAAVERFHEFAIRVILRSRHIEPQQIESIWKLVSKQSERQLGAFFFLFLIDGGQSPPELPDSAFRNDVIHKGAIPSLQRSQKYAQSCFDYIMAALPVLMRSHSLEVLLEVDEYRITLETKHNLNPVIDFAHQVWNTSMTWHAGLEPDKDPLSLDKWIGELSAVYVPSRFKTSEELRAESPS